MSLKNFNKAVKREKVLYVYVPQIMFVFFCDFLFLFFVLEYVLNSPARVCSVRLKFCVQAGGISC